MPTLAWPVDHPPVPRYVDATDALHGLPMPLYCASLLHDAVDEITERDTLCIVTLPNGTTYTATDVHIMDDHRTARLDLIDDGSVPLPDHEDPRVIMHVARTVHVDYRDAVAVLTPS